MNVICPLCGGSKVNLIAQIRTYDIVILYKKSFKFDISSEFESIEKINFYHCINCDLRFFNPMVTGSESFYEKLQQLNWYYMDNKEEYNFAREFVKPDDIVLEVGCGKGAFAENISSKYYVGLEFSKKAQKMAQKKGIDARIETIQNHAIKFNSKYDVVFSFQVLEHVAEINSFIKSCIDCLKPRGILIYAVPSADSFLSLEYYNILNAPPHHVSWWSDICLKKLAKLFDLTMVKIQHEKLADYHKRPYTNTLILESLTRSIGYKRKLFDNSIYAKILNKIATELIRFLIRGFTNPHMLPDGHSVFAVYKKH